MRLVYLLLALGIGAGLHAVSATNVEAQKRNNPLKVAPNAPTTQPEVQSNPAPPSGGERADLCAELVSFVEMKSKTPPDEAAQKKNAQPAKSGDDKPGPENASVDKSQTQSGVSAPVPKSEEKSPPMQLTLEQAQSLAQSNDLRGCQQTIQKMRRAGVALPPSLLALAALREDLLLSGAQQRP